MRNTNFILLILLAAVLFFLHKPASAQENSTSCIDADFTDFNASSTISIAALQPGGISAVGNLTVGTAVKQVLDWSKNTSKIRQNYWLSSDPLITTPAQDLPYGGCIFMVFQSGDTSKWKLNDKVKAANGETNSSKILPPGCNDVFVKQLRDSAWRKINDRNRNDTLKGCSALNVSTPNECLGAWDSLMRGPYGPFGLTNWTAPWNFQEGRACPPGDSSRVFDGSPTKNGFFTDSFARYPSGELTTPIGNHSVYDYYVQRTTTLFIATWPREGQDIEPDVRSVSLTPQQKIEAGSRTPQKNNASGILSTKMLPFLAALLVLTLNI